MKDNAAKSPNSFAERYEAVLLPVIFRPWARELIRRAAPQNHEHVLDLACGTGAVTREVASSGVMPASLTGVDFNSGMLKVARDRAAEAGVEAEWVEADAGQLPFADDRFDVAFCVSTELSSNPVLQSQAAALEKHAGPEAGSVVRAICSLPDGNEIGGLFEAAGFIDVEVEEVSLTLHHPDGRAFAAGAMGGMHTGDKLAKLSEAKLEQCVDDFLTGLADFRDGTAIRFPHISNVVAARA